MPAPCMVLASAAALAYTLADMAEEKASCKEPSRLLESKNSSSSSCRQPGRGEGAALNQRLQQQAHA